MTSWSDCTMSGKSGASPVPTTRTARARLTSGAASPRPPPDNQIRPPLQSLRPANPPEGGTTNGDLLRRRFQFRIQLDLEVFEADFEGAAGVELESGDAPLGAGGVVEIDAQFAVDVRAHAA